jgi:hypothetical protein
VTLQNPHAAVTTLGEAAAAVSTSDVDLDQQLVSESAGGDSLDEITHPNVPLPDDALSEEWPDGSVCKAFKRPRVADVGNGCCVHVWVGFLSCSFHLF